MDLDDSEVTNDDEQEELTTAAQVVQKLEEVWVNEKLAPELLNYEGELVDCLLDQIQHMENNLQRIKKGDFRLIFHKMEVDRIKFVLNSYLRTRLEKIEKYAAHLINICNDDSIVQDLMSDEERQFCQSFVTSIKNYFHTVALQNMPTNMQSLPLEEMDCKPQLSRSVFIHAKKECRGVMIESLDYGDSEIIDLPKGSQHILRYSHVAELVKNGSVQLI